MDVEKPLDKLQHLFMIKSPGVERNFFNLEKVSMKISQLTSYSMVKDSKLFPQDQGQRQGCLFLPHLCNMVLQVLARAINKMK